jgi:hypothetical protein
MNDLFVACVRNSRLGSCFPVESTEEGLAMIRGLVKERLGRDLTEEEGEILECDMEFYSDSDSDNVVSFTVGSMN